MDLLRFRYLLVNGYCPWLSVAEMPRNSFMEVNIPEDKLREIADREIISQIKLDKLRAYQQTGLPPDPCTWTAQEAATWFEWLSESWSLDNQFSRHVLNNGITGSMLCCMNEQNLHDIFCAQGANVDLLYQHLQFWKTVEPMKIEEMSLCTTREREMLHKESTPKLHIEEPLFYQHQYQQPQHEQQQQQQHHQQYRPIPCQSLNYTLPGYITVPVYSTTTKRVIEEVEEEEPQALDLSTHSSRHRTDHLGCLDLSLKKTVPMETEPRSDSARSEYRSEVLPTRNVAPVVRRSAFIAELQSNKPSAVEFRKEVKMEDSESAGRIEDYRGRAPPLPLRSHISVNVMEGNNSEEKAPSIPENPNRCSTGVEGYGDNATTVPLNSHSASSNVANYTPKVKIEPNQSSECPSPLHINFYNASTNSDDGSTKIKTEPMDHGEQASCNSTSTCTPKDDISTPVPDVPAVLPKKTAILNRVERPVPVKRKRGRPPKPKPPGFEKRKKVHPILWRFLLEGLNDPKMSDALVWVKKEEGLFRFVSENKDKFAQMWGERKGNKSLMTYSKMARALRHYGKKGIFQEFRRRLHYKFNPNYIQKYFLKQKNGENKR